MSETPVSEVLRGLFRRHERGLALAWLVGVGLFGLAVVVGPVRGAVVGRIGTAVDWWEGRWTERLLEGERLVAEGRFDEAVSYLERLDEIHPARNVRHARDREREYLLRLLAASYEALDRRSRTIETYQRLVDFDPNHYRNYFELAKAYDRLESRSVMAPEARDAFAAALAILPVHLPSVRGYLTYYLDRGEFIPVVEGYERYMDAYFVQYVRVEVGEESVEVPVLVDGRQRDYEIALAAGVDEGEFLTLRTGGFAAELERVRIRPARRVGDTTAIEPLSVDLDAPALEGFERDEQGRLLATGADPTFRLRVPSTTALGGLEVRIALFKPVDQELWSVVQKSYENLLDESGLIEAARRTVPFESPEAADAVMARLEWAQAGMFQTLDGVED